jgi:hypothetical protein
MSMNKHFSSGQAQKQTRNHEFLSVHPMLAEGLERELYHYSARRKETLHSAQLEYMRKEKETIHSIHKAAMQNAPK